MSNKSIVSPISIDLGAKNTGAYFAHYKADSLIENIEREGKVYQLEKNNYTLLMANRTAARHQRRGYDRRQMVKRLFKLIWEKHFELEWNKDIQQTTSFLLNRRGFTFVTEEYNEEILRRFPEEVYELLPDELKIDASNGEYDFAGALIEWANEGKEKVSKFYGAINKEPSRIKERQVFASRTKKLREYCETRKQGERIEEKSSAPVKLSRLSKWIWDKWKQNGVQGLDENFVAKNDDGSEIEWKSASSSYDLVTWLNKQSPEVVCQILNSLPDTSREYEDLKASVWDFTTENFKPEEQDFRQPESPQNANKKERDKFEKEKREWKKRHIWHLAYALHKTLDELESGGRHRSQYFKEVKQVLNDKNHTCGYLKNFCVTLQSGGYPGLNKEKLVRLIGHLSNLELKPLRKYFNDKKHASVDCWNDETLLRDIFDRWILREWRVNLEKDTNKGCDKPGDYKKLCKTWDDYKKARPDTIINFWLETDPVLTIPPYQDNNNRRPPKCQNLILNPKFLDKEYPQWQTWLTELRKLQTVECYLGDFENQLQNLKSGKGSSYFPDHEKDTQKTLDARTLQFIFDRVKANDPLQLNEIYSHVKKWRQKQSTDQEKKKAKSNLEKAIGESELPDELKTRRDYSDEGLLKKETFLHLVCKYYKWRQRAKDGRLFIHPQYHYVKERGYESAGRFDDKDCLLTYCNQKPRQKRRQSVDDVAGVLQIPPDELRKIVGCQSDDDHHDLVSWLEGERFRGLKSLCEKSANAQKEHRGELKTRLNLAIQNKDEKDPLYKLHTSLGKISGKIGEDLFRGDEQEVRDQKTGKFRSPFSFAQIYNIAFKDRNGYSNTCPICSADNAHRMQSIAIPNGNDSNKYSAKASRLPAIPTRLIDGAVMRMARIVGGAIAEDKWKKIECELQAGKHVCVPIITESNRFEFEPSKEELVKSQRTKARKGKALDRSDAQDFLKEKDQRIKEASRGRCPYTGQSLGNSSDKDHIIPRSSKWGALNDEANLIWASGRGNKEIKQDKEFSLADLDSTYKQKQFGKSTDEEIEKWIIEQIGDGEGETFKFGRYRSFINLTQHQQKAFRHALFLKEHPLRERVISAIDNRTRTLVNGTQRYFTEVIANNLHKKARTIGKQGLLSFDFFGVEAQSNTRGDGIRDLRSEYEKAGLLDEKYSKEKGARQEPYSHLIDAQLAFAIAADQHKNEGGLRLTIPDSTRLYPADKDTGEIFQKTIFGSIQIKPDEMGYPRELKRRKTYDVETHHRQMIARNRKPSISYQIHRDSIFRENFFPILKLKDGTFRKGFNHSNSVNFDAEDFLLLQENKFVLQTSGNERYETWSILKQNCQQFLMETGATGANKQEIKIAKILDNLSYQTIKKPLETVLIRPRENDRPPKTVREALDGWADCVQEKNFRKDGVLLPVWSEWCKFHQLLLRAEEERPFYEFVKNCSLFANKQSKNGHNKIRKVFSLPVKADIGNIRLQRASWDKTPIIQIVSEESLSKYGYDGKGRPHTILSKRSVPIKHYTGIPDSLDVEGREWKKIPLEEINKLSDNLKKIGIKHAEIIYQDAIRCMVRLTVPSVESLSLPQNKPDWIGKIICHENEEEMEKARKQGKNDNYHCLSSQYKWFDAPFALPRNRRKVSIKTTLEGQMIEFTISKSRQAKEWLAG